jgi:hypothetical protein
MDIRSMWRRGILVRFGIEKEKEIVESVLYVARRNIGEKIVN